MSENNEKLEATQAEAQNLLDQIKQFKTQAEEQFKAAETARKNADSEGLFAVNAKRTCEEHATAISKLKGTVETDINSIETNKQKADDLAAFITAKKPVIEDDIEKIEGGRKEVEQSATRIKDAAEKGSSRLKEIETSKGSADSLLEEVQQLRDAAAEARKKAEAAQSQADEFLTKITVAHTTSKDSSEKINGILANAEKEQETLAKIVEHLTKSSEITDSFEAELKALKKEAEELLPGFADVSLASAFGQRKRRFLIPKVAWILTFVFCIGCLIYIAYPSFREATSSTVNLHEKQWEDIWRSLAMRLPIVLPLIWLAIYAGRNYMLSIRLEEDYAYKEAVSKSFSGYKREMEKLASAQAAGPENPVTILCVNVLKAIAEHPLRIYEGKQQDINLMTETHAATEQIVELSKKQVANR
jgi:hypothetical protein